MMKEMQERDFAAIRQSDGRYIIQQVRDGHFVAVADHGERYDEDEARRRLAVLKPLGDGWIANEQIGFELVQS